MNNQRKILVAAVILGAISMFIPWVTVPILGPINGMVNPISNYILGSLGIILIMALTGDGRRSPNPLTRNLDTSTNINYFKFWTSTALSIFVSIFAISKIYDLSNLPPLTSLGLGSYLLAMSGISILIALFGLKNHKYEGDISK